MYNVDFKKRYLDENETRNVNIKKTVDLLFRRIESTEEMLGKDLYDFSVAEILGFYKRLFTPSFDSLMIMNNQYKLYTAYALKNGLVADNQNHYAEIDNATLKTCVHDGLAKAKIISRKDLMDILTTNMIENISEKVIALALFEGICGKELTELTHLHPRDIDTHTCMVYLYGGRELHISHTLVNWCMESASEYNYYNSAVNVINKHYLESDDRVIKRLANSVVDNDLQRHKTINRRLDHMIELTGCNAFGVSSLRESGRLEEIRILREKGNTLEQALKDKKMLYRYGPIPSLKRYCLKYDLK